MPANTPNFLGLYDAAPVEQKHQLVMGWLSSSPLEFLDQLRQQQPVLATPLCTLCTNLDDILEILRLPDVFTAALYRPMMGDYFMALDDSAPHTREKSVMKVMLNRDDLPRIRDFVGAQAQELLNRGKGRIEMAYGYGRAVTTALVQQIFGLDGVPPQSLIEWSYWNQYDAFHNQPFNIVRDPEMVRRRSAEGRQSLAAYVAELIPRRIAEIKAGKAPGDVVARMLQTSFPTSVGFPIERLARNVVGLLIGTVETSSAAVLYALQELLRRPLVLASASKAARKAGDPAFAGFVWEALRFHPVLPYLFRQTSRDCVIARGTPRETRLAAGTNVLAMTLAAMFDPQRYPDPNRFDPNRLQDDSFHFGFGLHECLGKHVASEVVPEMVRQVLLRTGLRAETSIEYRDRPLPERYVLTYDA